MPSCLVGAVFCAKAVADQLAPGIFEADLDEACVPVIPEPLTSSRCAPRSCCHGLRVY